MRGKGLRFGNLSREQLMGGGMLLLLVVVIVLVWKMSSKSMFGILSPTPPPTPGTVGSALGVQSMQIPNKDKITIETPVNMYPNIGPKEPGGCNKDILYNIDVTGFSYNGATDSCVKCNSGGVFNGIKCVSCDDYTKYWDLTSQSCNNPKKCPPGQVFNTNTNFGPIGCMDQQILMVG